MNKIGTDLKLINQLKNKLDDSNSLYVDIIHANDFINFQEKWIFEFDSDNRISSLKRSNNKIYTLLSEVPNGVIFRQNDSCEYCYYSCSYEERIRLYPTYERVIGEITIVFDDTEYSKITHYIRE